MKRAVDALLLLLVTLLAAALVLVPAVAMRPFAPQTPEGLALAHGLTRALPWAGPLLVALALVFAWRLLRGPWAGGGRRALAGIFAVVAVAAVAFAAWAGRTSMAERFFAPLDDPRFVVVAEAGLDDDAMVLGIELGGEARAYPVAIIGYHHLVHDEVAGEPVVATY